MTTKNLSLTAKTQLVFTKNLPKLHHFTLFVRSSLVILICACNIYQTEDLIKAKLWILVSETTSQDINKPSATLLHVLTMRAASGGLLCAYPE